MSQLTGSATRNSALGSTSKVIRFHPIVRMHRQTNTNTLYPRQQLLQRLIPSRHNLTLDDVCQGGQGCVLITGFRSPTWVKFAVPLLDAFDRLTKENLVKCRSVWLISIIYYLYICGWIWLRSSLCAASSSACWAWEAKKSNRHLQSGALGSHQGISSVDIRWRCMTLSVCCRRNTTGRHACPRHAD